MSRNGPVGQPRAPGRRSTADQDQYAGGQSGWPSPPGADPHQQGYAPHPGHAPQHSQGYYFPQPAEPDPSQGYALQPVNQALPFDRLQSPLNGIWGELDAPANPKGPERVAILRAHRTDADVRLIPATGHWAAYEAAETVNAMLLEMLARTRP